jgi:uncharacterized protein (TIGR03437 family)
LKFILGFGKPIAPHQSDFGRELTLRQRQISPLRTIFALLTLLLLTVSTTAAAAAKERLRYYRQPSAAKKVPRQAGAPEVLNAASFLPGVSPGGLATVFGQNLTTVNGSVLANTNPLPTSLAGVEVDVNGVPAPIFSVAFANGEDQISFQVPYHTDTGPNAAVIDVFDFGAHVASIISDSFIEDPGIFAYGSNSYAVAVRSFDGSLIGPDNPAAPGETIVLYVTALGPLSIDLRDGFGAPSNPLAYTIDPFDVLVDGEPCRVLFSGLGPGFVGLYQLNLVLPPDLPRGNLQIQITSPYASSQVATLPVF